LSQDRPFPLSMLSLVLVFNVFYSLFSTTLSEPAPNIRYETTTGASSHLYTHKGQVVYVSIWASWCKPCLENYKKYESVRAQLEKEGVVLLNVSIDRNPDLWRAAVEKHDYINGTNVLATDISRTMKDYRISKVPDYHIIDKSGHFVYLSDNAGRDIIEEFRAWL